MNRIALAIALLIAGLIAGAGAGYWFARHRPAPAATTPTAESGAPAQQSDRKVLYWYDPMYPQSRFDKPGKSPFMDMQLVPKYADEGGTEGGVSVSPRLVQTLGVRTVEVKRSMLEPRMSAVGSVEYNERTFVVVQPRAGGFIERLHVRAALDSVRQGDPLVEMLIPDWAAAQEEYLLLRSKDNPALRDLAAAARQRLVLLGMSESEIAAIERSGKPQLRVTLTAPTSGIVAELGVRQGMTVQAGATLFRIAGLGSVWVVAEVPEAQAAALVPGSRVEVSVAAYPGEKLSGRVTSILPELNAATRTLRARIEVPNASGKLKPGMFANVQLAGSGRETLVVPGDAVIRTGERNVVIVAEGKGQFRPVEVEIGMEAGGSTEIRKGLKAGDQVVVSGQFLIDSEASLRSALDRLQGPETAPTAQAAGKHAGTGKVTGVDPAKGRVELEHGPIPSMKWPSMKMGFAVEDRAALANIRQGDAVEFEMRGEPDKAGDYVITRIAPAAGKTP